MIDVLLASVMLFNSANATPQQAVSTRVFDGTDDVMVNAEAPITTYPLTLCAWFQIATGEAQQQRVMVAVDRVTSSSDQYFLEWGRNEAAANAGYVCASTKTSSTSRDCSTAEPSYGTGVWNHACAVFSSTNGINNNKREVFLNGTSGGINTVSRALTVAPTHLHIGAKTGGNLVLETFWKGKLAHVAVWSRALTEPEIDDLAGEANGGTNGTANNPMNASYDTNRVAYYPFGPLSAGDIQDATAGDYDVTVTGTTEDQADLPTVEAAP